jgi:hypothetical protein
VLFTIPVLISIFLLVGESQSPVISSIPAPYFCSARLGSGSCSPLADFYDFRWLIFPVSVLVPGVLLACLSVACWSATSSSLCSCAKLRPLNSLRAVRASAGQIRWRFGLRIFLSVPGVTVLLSSRGPIRFSPQLRELALVFPLPGSVSRSAEERAARAFRSRGSWSRLFCCRRSVRHSSAVPVPPGSGLQFRCRCSRAAVVQS